MDKHIKKILILISIIMFFTGKGCFAIETVNEINVTSLGETENNDSNNDGDFNYEINNEKSNLGINSFLNDSQKYINEDDFNISNIFENAIDGKFDNNKILKYCLNLFGENFKNAIMSIAGIVIIVIITAILKSISENLGNESTGRIAFYVEYILVVMILMKNFSQIVGKTRETIQNTTAFSNSLIPLLGTLIITTGKINSTGVIEPILLLIVSFINNVISNLVIPVILAATALGVISKISDEIKVDKISKFMKKGTIWGISTVLTLFITIASLEGGLASNLDTVTKKAGKSVISVAVPVVGNILGGAIDTISRIYKFIKKCCWNHWNCGDCINLCKTNNKFDLLHYSVLFRWSTYRMCCR